MQSRYDLWLNDVNGHRRGILSRFLKLEYSRASNNVLDTLIVTLPGDADLRLLQPDCTIEVWRTPFGGTKQLDGETVWFIRYVNVVLDKNGAMTIIVQCYAAIELLSRRIVAYDDGTNQANRTDYADDVLKELVNDNFNAGATDTARNISTWLSYAPTQHLAPVITKAFAWRPVDAVMTEICQYVAQGDIANGVTPTNLFFDIIASPDGQNLNLTFQTYIGQRGNLHGADSGHPVTFSGPAGNITEAQREYDYRQEVTYVYAAGPGSGADRQYITAENTNGTNRSYLGRREDFINSSNAQLPAPNYGQVDTAKMAGDAAQALKEKQAKRRFWCDVQDIPQCTRGIHWNWGDVVSVVFAGETVDYRVDAFKVTVENQRETCAVRLMSESNI